MRKPCLVNLQSSKITGRGFLMAEQIDAITNVMKKYPKIAKHLNNTVIKFRYGKSKYGGGLEFIPSWESGEKKHVIEIYDKEITGERLEQAIAGDMLHLMGAINPETNEPVDPDFYKFKQKYREIMTPEQIDLDKRVFENYVKPKEPGRSFENWDEDSRSDAHLRGYLFPDQNDEWRKSGAYTPEQTELLNEAGLYLKKK